VLLRTGLNRGERAPQLNNLFIAAEPVGPSTRHGAFWRRCFECGGRSSAPRARIEFWSGQVGLTLCLCFNDSEEIGPPMLARIGRVSGLQSDDL
jgi:hypothetical protein